MATNSKDLIGLKKVFIDRIRKLKIRVVEVESQMEDLDTLIKKAVKEFIKTKVRKMVVREVTKQLEHVYTRLEGKIINGYFDWINKLVANQIERKVEEGVNYKLKVKGEFECGVNDLKRYYDKGWKLAFFGELGAKEGKVFVFHKAKKTKKKKEK